MFTGTVTFVSGKGWFFAERDDDSSAIFVHQNEVENNRYLKINDRISFDVAPSTKNPGKTMAVNVKYVSHLISRQISGKAAL